MTQRSLSALMIPVFLVIAGTSAAHAETMTCSDASAKLRYENYVQSGGPCCGRSSSSLIYDGALLKRTSVINGGFGHAGSRSDTNPALTITRAPSIDLQNSSTDERENRVRSFVAMNLTLQRTDGAPVLPGGTRATEIISVVCEIDSDLRPVP